MSDVNWTQIIAGMLGLTVVNIASQLVLWGRIREQIKNNTCDIKEIKESDLRDINKILNPADPKNRFITVSECDYCQKLCEQRQITQFSELKEMLSDNNDKRDDIICRLSRIEGSLEHKKADR